MCTLLFRHRPGDSYPIAILANRDERYQRPSGGWAWRGRDRRYFSPVDLQAGGTWIGLNENGVGAALTNISPWRRDHAFRSRGILVTDVLGLARAGQAPAQMRQMISTQRYNNFNLLVADPVRAYLFTWQGCDLVQHDVTSSVCEVANRPFDGNTLPDDAAANETWIAENAKRLYKHPEVCKHGFGFGTCCSHKLLVHGTEPSRSRVWHLGGHPCRGEYELVLGHFKE